MHILLVPAIDDQPATLRLVPTMLATECWDTTHAAPQSAPHGALGASESSANAQAGGSNDTSRRAEADRVMLGLLFRRAMREPLSLVPPTLESDRRPT